VRHRVAHRVGYSHPALSGHRLHPASVASFKRSVAFAQMVLCSCSCRSF
jgi:hypothetical protein